VSAFSDFLGALAAPPAGRCRRVSSNEQPNWNDGNFDMTPLAPGETLELPLLEGPGVITHIWMTSHAGGVNELGSLSLRIYWDGLQLDALPAETPYFHARYRQEYPAVMGRDYLVADLQGRGRYVGTVLSVTLAQDGWFGEGDDFFFIDGEEVPSLQGTGTEDYF